MPEVSSTFLFCNGFLILLVVLNVVILAGYSIVSLRFSTNSSTVSPTAWCFGISFSTGFPSTLNIVPSYVIAHSLPFPLHSTKTSQPSDINSSNSFKSTTPSLDRKSTRLNSSHVSTSYLYTLYLHDSLPI